MPDQTMATQQAPQTHASPGIDAAPLGATPVLGFGVLDTLHQAIGNRAVGRMIESQRRASGEGVTRITPWQQQQIEVIRRGGSDLPGAAGVRMHNDSNAAAMASSLRARAFTQGRDIFFGDGVYAPGTEAGRNTLAHELVHVSEGRAVAGTVQKDDEPNASMPEPNASQEPKYSITLTTGTQGNLSKADAIQVLSGVYQALSNKVDLVWGEHDKVESIQSQGFFEAVGDALTNLAGEARPDSFETWRETNEALAAVRGALGSQNVEEAGDKLKEADLAFKAAAEKWFHYKEQLESAAFKAKIEIVVVAVIVVVVIATAGGAGMAATAGGGAPVGGAAAGGAVVGGEATAGGAAMAATVPVDAAAAGVASTALDVGAATAPGAAAAAAPAAAGAAAVPAAGAAAAGGGVVAASAVDSLIAQAMAAFASGGQSAVAELGASWGPELLGAVLDHWGMVLSMSAPFTSAGLDAMNKIYGILWRVEAGFPPRP